MLDSSSFRKIQKKLSTDNQSQLEITLIKLGKKKLQLWLRQEVNQQALGLRLKCPELTTEIRELQTHCGGVSAKAPHPRKSALKPAPGNPSDLIRNESHPRMIPIAVRDRPSRLQTRDRDQMEFPKGDPGELQMKAIAKPRRKRAQTAKVSVEKCDQRPAL